MIASGIALLGSLAAMAQEKAPSNYERLKGLQFITGVWHSERAIPDGIPGFIPAGVKRATRSENRWILNRNFICWQYDGSLQSGGTDQGPSHFSGLEIAGWSPKENKIVHWAFGSSGLCATGVWKQEGDSWRLDWSGADPEKNRIQGTGVLRSARQSGYFHKMVSLSLNDKPLADWPEAAFVQGTEKPVIASPRGEEPKPRNAELQKLLGWLVGNWEGEAKVAAEFLPEKLTARFQTRWILDKHFLQCSSAFKDADGNTLIATSEVIGFDPREGRIQWWAFNRHGGTVTRTLADRQQDGTQRWRGMYCSSEGESFEETSAIKRVEKDTYRVEYTSPPLKATIELRRSARK